MKIKNLCWFNFFFEKFWNDFVVKYIRSHFKMMNYLTFIYYSIRQRFVKYYINEMRYFMITITSREKNKHAALKKQLGIFKNDFKTIIDDINLLLINELHNYLIVFNSTKDRFSIDSRNKAILQWLTKHVILFALWKIMNQYCLLIKQFTAIKACIESFIIIIDLFCSHKIQKRLYDDDENREILLLNDIHFHWKWILINIELQFINFQNLDLIKKDSIVDNVILSMQDSFFVQFRDRFRDFENRKQQIFEVFTLRKSSLFEWMETKITIQKVTMKIVWSTGWVSNRTLCLNLTLEHL